MGLPVSHPPAEPHRLSVGPNGHLRVADIPRPDVNAAPNVRIVDGDCARPAVGHRQADRAAVEVGPRKNVVPFLLHPRAGPEQMVRQDRPQARMSRRGRVISPGKGHHFGRERHTVAQQHRKHALPRAAGLAAPDVLSPCGREQSVERLLDRGDVGRLVMMRRAGRRVVQVCDRKRRDFTSGKQRLHERWRGERPDKRHARIAHRRVQRRLIPALKMDEYRERGYNGRALVHPHAGQIDQRAIDATRHDLGE